MGRKRREATEQRKPLTLWEPPPDAGEPVACLASTFEFDATFFEVDCLGRFLAMENQPGESDAVGYLIEREERLAETPVCVLVDRSRATSKDSLRWDVLPIVVSRGIQHSKVSLLVWSNYVRVIVGSGNLTESGYRKNVEVFGKLDLSKATGGAHQPVSLAIDFLEAVIERGVGDVDRNGPKQRAIKTITDVRNLIRDWPSTASSREVSVTPVFSGLGRSVIQQLQKTWPSPLKPRHADVLSPFFDREPQETPLIPQLLTLLSQRGEASVKFHVSGDRQQDGCTKLQAPAGLLAAIPAKCGRSLAMVPLAQEGEMEQRPLHAKALELSAEDCVLRMIGSSNFTTAGYGVGRTPGNLEANLVYVVREHAAIRDLNRVWPTVEELAPDDESLIWEPAVDEAEEDAAGTVLPIGFREALFCPMPQAHLLLILDESLPEEWSISTVDDVEILRQSGLEDAPAADVGETRQHHREIAVPWSGPPPFLLCVRWLSANGPRTADWPVNVSDADQLAPPEELRSLSLTELIQVLGSTRPLHEAVPKVLKQRGKVGSSEAAALDPHQRVRTETFLLERLKRVALALDGMKQRLERPAAHEPAFHWRLFGPIGPRALMHALQREATHEGELSFFVAELALALKRVDLSKIAAGGLPVEQAKTLLKQCLNEIADSALSPPATENASLQQYVAAALKEALQ